MADDYEFDDDNNEENDEFEDEDSDEDNDDDSDDEDSDLEDEDEEDDEEEDDEDLDDGEDTDIEAVLSENTQIPLVQEPDGEVKVDEERLSETEPSDINNESWQELLGKGYTFEDISEYYGEDSIYEIEIGIDYAEAA